MKNKPASKNYVRAFAMIAGLLMASALSLKAQTAPVLQVPSNGAVNINPSVSVWFNQMNNVEKVEYEFDTDQTFGNSTGEKISGSVVKAALGSGVANNVNCYYFNVNGLLFGKTYYLRMRALDAANLPTDWSTSRSFSTVSTLTVQSPSNNATNIHPQTQVWFNQVSGLSKMEYEFDTDQTFGNADGNKVTASVTSGNFGSGVANNVNCYYVSVNGLKFGLTYYIRIRGYNINNVASDWSASRSLTTVSTLTVQSPSNNATNIHPQTQVWFNQLSGLSKMEYEFDTDQTFGNADGNKVTASVTSGNFGSGVANNVNCYYVSVNGLKFGLTYYMRIRGYNINNVASDWSASRSITTVSTLTVQSPSNNATNIHPQTQVWFNQLSGLSKMEYEFDTDQTFGNADGNKVTASVTSGNFGSGVANNVNCYYVSVNGLKFGLTYYVRIRGYNINNVASDWSASRSITTVSTLTMQSPADKASEINPVMQVWFNQLNGLSKVEYEFDTDPDFSNSTSNRISGSVNSGSFGSGVANNVNCYYINAGPVKFGVTYYLRIRGYNSNNVPSQWSATRELSIRSKVQLSSPADNAVNVSTGGSNLQWLNSGESGYEVELSTSNLFTSNIFSVSQTATSKSTGALSSNTSYFWRVRGKVTINAQDYFSDWSERRFSTGSTLVTLPSAPSLTAPANNATDQLIDPLLQWSEVSGASYKVQYGTDKNFIYNVSQSDVSAGTMQLQLNGLANNTVIYWRVRAVNGQLASTWSGVYSFTTEPVKLPVSVTISNNSYSYDGTVKNVTITTDPVGVSHTVSYTLNGTVVSAPTHAGTYAVSVTITDNQYKLSGNGSGELVISKVPLTITAENKVKTYGDDNPQFTLQYEGFVNNETSTVLNTLPQASTTAEKYSNTGAYIIELAGGSDNDYTYTLVNGELSITKASLTISADNKTKMYGDDNPALTYSFTGLLGSDNSSVIDVLPSTATTAEKYSNVGTYDITLTNASDNNYTIELVAGQLTVEKAPLTITADNKSKIYGAVNPSLTMQFSGFVNNEDASVIDVLPAITTAATATSSAGTYSITFSGGQDNNYAFTFTNGSLTINKADLTISINDNSRTYGTANPDFTAQYTGFVGSDDVSVIDALPVMNTIADLSSNTGSYEITGSGGSDNNYNLIIVNGTLTITKADQTITMDDISTMYLGMPAFEVNATTNAQLPLTFQSSNTAVATIDGNVITIAGTGTTEITVTQPGNQNYNEASVTKTLIVLAKESQTITFEIIPDVVLGNQLITLQATSDAGLPVSFQADNNKVSIEGSIMQVLAAGKVTVTATQPGNFQYLAAESVSQTFCIKPGAPVLTLENNNTEEPVLRANLSDGIQWYRNNEWLQDQTSGILKINSPGVYYATLSTDECVSEKSNEISFLITDIEQAESSLFEIYPNPVQDRAVIQFGEAGNSSVALMTSTGKNLLTLDVDDTHVTIEMSNYPGGVYFLLVRNKNGFETKKFIKK